MGRLLDSADESATGAHDDLFGPDDAGALSLEKVSVDRDASSAFDLTVRKNAPLAHHELGPFAQRDRALLEQAFDLDERAGVELERRVPKHVALAEIAAGCRPVPRPRGPLACAPSRDPLRWGAARSADPWSRGQPARACGVHGS